MYLKKNKKTKIIFLISLIQIFLIITLVPAYSYSINQENFSNQNQFQTGYKVPSKFLTNFLILLKKFLSISQIGIVSAAEDVSFNCCLETNEGGICQNIISGSDSSEDPNSCEDPLPTSCQESALCKTGTCIYEEGLSCSANAPRGKCEEEGGTWNQGAPTETFECEKGACVLGSKIQFTTEKQCELLSNSLGIRMDFRRGLGESSFQEILDDLSKGACLTGGSCRFLTANECNNLGGNNFIEDFLCTNPNLETNCLPTEETTIFENKIYFIDSCGNLGNIYDSSKINSEDNPNYWSFTSETPCFVDLKDSNSVKSCGNCDIFLSSQGIMASPGDVNYGNYVCDDLRCTDNEGKKRYNGERWCEYDGYIGDGKDTAGSEHWIASCNNGDVEINACGNYRSGLCEQRVIEDNGETFSTAACVANKAFECFDYNDADSMEQNCNKNPQCVIKNLDIARFFDFSFCTSAYPRGLKAGDEENIGLCAIASQECTVTYKKSVGGKWKPKYNEDCEKREFGEKMNDFCISLGDCGSYINYQGKGTDNTQIIRSPAIPWNEYTSYANHPSGQYVELEETSGSSTAVGVAVIGTGPIEEIDIAALEMAASGVAAGAKVAGLFFGKVYAGAEATFLTTGSTSKAIAAESAMVESSGSIASVKSFGAAAAGFLIGSYAGKALAKSLGITGGAAQVMAVAAGVAGAAIGTVIMEGAFSTANIYVIVIAVIIIAVIAITGIGKTKEKTVSFSCLPWQAPTGGSDCDECGDDGRPCTEYRCESLGQACKLINGNTDNPVCQSLTPESIPPNLSPGEILTEEYIFQNEEPNSVEIRKTNGECIQEFTPVLFTLKTDEYAQCKWSLEPTATYESMTNYAAEGTEYSLNHTFGVEGLSLSLLEENGITGNMIDGFLGDFKMYIKCQDSFGNFNFNEFVVDICIASGPDITPVDHTLTITNPANGTTLKHGVSETDLTMWINEPAECKYTSTEGISYELMENSMACETNLSDRETYGWPCEATLTNLVNEYNFYMKCLDQPWKSPDEEELRNVNTEDFVYTIYVTENNLEIDSASVSYLDSKIDLDLESETVTEVKGGGEAFLFEIEIHTSNGVDNGISACSFGWENHFIPFFETNSDSHKQKFDISGEGNYTLPINCVDQVGNEVTKNLLFNLSIDKTSPSVVRVYNKDGKLKIITDEPTKCYVSLDEELGCNFNIDEAIIESSIGFDAEHSIHWVPEKIYYIKCEDVWENVNQGCSIIVTQSLTE